MARRRHTAEEIVAKLRQADVLMAQGSLIEDAVRAIAGHSPLARRVSVAHCGSQR
jgi:hypothetical protein